MNIRTKQLLTVILCVVMLGNIGCTTMHSVHGSPEALAEKKIRVGDKVTLHTVTGRSIEAKLTNIGEESVSATTTTGQHVEIDYDDLLSLDHKEVEVLKTAGAAVGVVALGAVLVSAAAVGTMMAAAGGT